MAYNNVFSHPTSRIQTHYLSPCTSDNPQKIHKVPRQALVKAYPITPGEAKVYATNTPAQVSELDDDNYKIEVSENASWDIWEAGTVSEKTIQQTNVPVETIAIVVISGDWVLEVTAQ